VNPKEIHQFLNKATDSVLQPFVAETIADNFGTNAIEEPSNSGWDTTPAASAIKFFGGMADEERRRGLFGDDNEDE
jgi:hypothetical protein